MTEPEKKIKVSIIKTKSGDMQKFSENITQSNLVVLRDFEITTRDKGYSVMKRVIEVNGSTLDMSKTTVEEFISTVGLLIKNVEVSQPNPQHTENKTEVTTVTQVTKVNRWTPREQNHLEELKKLLVKINCSIGAENFFSGEKRYVLLLPYGKFLVVGVYEIISAECGNDYQKFHTRMREALEAL